MNKRAPIGIFDSGVGGTSIWKEIYDLLPMENTLYLADSKHAPYGYKTKEEIISLSIKNTEFLLEQGAKIIVVACNTATTNAIATLRARYAVPFIGIEPAIKPAALKSHSGHIGILATKGTLSSELFHKTSEELTSNVKVTEVVGEGLVSLIEAGRLDSPEVIQLLEKYTQPMVAANVDYLVLGCSHYPYIIPQLRKVLPAHIKIIDSGEAVALQTKAILKKHNLLNDEKGPNEIRFFTNAEVETLQWLLRDYIEKITIEKKDF
ncbi:MAG: glutamate racemase [Bacteroidota bacterium]